MTIIDRMFDRAEAAVEVIGFYHNSLWRGPR